MKKIQKKKLGKIVGGLLVTFFTCVTVYMYAAQGQDTSVTLGLSQAPSIDVIVSKSQTQANVSTLEQDLKNEIIRRGIMSEDEVNAGKLNIKSIQTANLESQDSFPWEDDIDADISELNTRNNGKNIEITGSTDAGKNAMWIIPNENQAQTIEFGYNIDFGNSFNAAGVLLRVQKNGNTLEGYMLSFNNPGKTFATASGNSNASLWKFRYNIFDNSANFTFGNNKDLQHIASLDLNNEGTLRLKVSDESIIISGGGLTEDYTYNLDLGTFGNGYGFFSDHYSHSSGSNGTINFTNIRLTTETARTLADVVQSPDWRDNAVKILINIEDAENELLEGSSANEIASKLMNNDVHFLGWGTTWNKGQIEKLISKNANKGIYIENSSSNAISRTVDYIEGILPAQLNSDKVIVGENILLTVKENIPSTTVDFPKGVWKVEHDPTYYDNNLGQYENNGQFIEELMKSFNKSGKYDIYYKNGSNPVTTIYAHRRPVATFSIEIVDNIDSKTLNLRSTSYDLDLENQSDNYEEQKSRNGIKEEKWEYKRADDKAWTPIQTIGIGAQTSIALEERTDYFVKLTVTDYQGVSSETVKSVTTKDYTVLPVAQFKLIKNQINFNENIPVVEDSYDPSGLRLTKQWKIKNKDGVYYQGETSPAEYSFNSFSNPGTGSYDIELIVSKVVNGQTISSAPFVQTVSVASADSKPEIMITPIAKRSDIINIHLTINGFEHSIVEYQYTFSKNKEEAADSDVWTVEDADDRLLDVNIDKSINDMTEDNWSQPLYLHVSAITDNDTEVSKVAGPYYFEPSYDLIVKAFDQDTNKEIAGQRYTIIGEYADTTRLPIEIVKDVATDITGHIRITKVPLQGVSSISIISTKGAAGYKSGDLKIVSVDTTNWRMNLNTGNTSEGIIATAEERSLTVQIPVAKETFDLKVINRDKDSGAFLGDSEFILKGANNSETKGATGSNGEVILTTNISSANSTGQYILLQNSVNSLYNKYESPINLIVQFDGEGKATNVGLLSNTSAYVGVENGAIVVRNERKERSSFNVGINVRDINTGKPVAGSEYKVLVDLEVDGKLLQYETPTAISDSEGNLVINGLFGTGVLKLNLINTKAGTGYVVNTNETYITITRNENGDIECVEPSVIGTFDRFDSDAKTIYVKTTNDQKASKNVLKIKAGLKYNNSVGIEGIEFKVYNYNNELVGTGLTNSDGILELDIENDGINDVLYYLETENKDIIENRIAFTISYEKRNGKTIIKNADLWSGANANIRVYKSEDDDEDFYKYTANIQIDVSSQALTGKNKVIITSVSSVNTEAKLSGIEYKVKVIRTIDGREVEYLNTYRTDEYGEAEITIPDDDSVKVIIQQIGTIDGHNIDSTERTMIVKHFADGKLSINNTTNIEGTNIAINEDGNVILRDIIQSYTNTTVIFRLGATNLNGVLNLSGLEFEIEEPVTGYKQTVTTNASGYIEAKLPFVATESRTYNFSVEQKNSIYPYMIPDSKIQFSLSFSKEDKIVRFNAVEYTEGNKYLFSKSNVYDRDKNLLIVEFNVLNHKDPNAEGNAYDIDIKKLNSKGQVATGSVYDVEIRPYAAERIIASNVAIKDGIEIPDLSIKREVTTILLKEVTPALGCNLDEDFKIVTIYLDQSGNIQWDSTTTSKNNVKVNIKSEVVDGRARTIVEIVLTAEVPHGTGTNPNPGPEDPDKPDNRPTTLTFNIYNRRYGSWNYSYKRTTIRNYIDMHIHNNVEISNSKYSREDIEVVPADYTGVQRLVRIFDLDESAEPNGFNLINALDIKVEARLVEDGIVKEETYEIVSAKALEDPNKADGTHKVQFKEDYKNKTVEFTIKEKVPEINYKKMENDPKFIVEFDEAGNVKTGNITQGIDVEDLAIGGISCSGITKDIQIIEKGEHIIDHFHICYGVSNKKEYETDYGEKFSDKLYSLDNFNSKGKSTIYLALLNKEIDNPLNVNINLKDKDTHEDINGDVQIAVIDATANAEKVVEFKIMNIKDGKAKITLDNTYANRELVFRISQTNRATKNNIKYKDYTGIYLQFRVLLDDEGNIIEERFEEEPSVTFSTAGWAELEGARYSNIEYTLYNEMDYNFAINVTKLDPEGNPLPGVRIKTTTSLVKDATHGETQKLFEYGSSLTDENGNVKLKIFIPTDVIEEEGKDQKFKTIEIKMDEYYVPDNYRAQQDMKVQVVMDHFGKIQSSSIMANTESGAVNITGNNTNTAEERTAIDVNITNSKLSNKPLIEITNVDLNENTKTLSGTKYQVLVRDEATYAVNSFDYNETVVSNETGEDGKATMQFENAHALRTMIYQIQEVKTADSYITNEDILLKVVFNEEGKIVKTPEIINPQTLENDKGRDIKVAQIVGEPAGSEKIILTVVSEMKPKFTINIKREDDRGRDVLNKEFKVELRAVDESGEEQLIETSITRELPYREGYRAGFKTDLTKEEYRSMTDFRYVIYERNGDVEDNLPGYTLRGEVKIDFDVYGHISSGECSGLYINQNRSRLEADKDYADVYIEVERFKVAIQIEDPTNSGYNLNGYIFKLENDKGEVSELEAKTDRLGLVVDVISGVYKGETVKYTISTHKSTIDHANIEPIELTITFNDDGEISSCTPEAVENSYKVFMTLKQRVDGQDANMQMKIYTRPEGRNTIKINLVDEDNPAKKIEYARYTVKVSNDRDREKMEAVLEEGEGIVDLGSYKLYVPDNTEKTVLFDITQDDVSKEYMKNEPMQIAITFDKNGMITKAHIANDINYAELVAPNGTSRELVMNMTNRKKTEMNLTAQNIEDENDKIDGAEFKIQQILKKQVEDKSLYSDKQMTNPEGRADLYVGPYYKNEEVEYTITNPKMNKEYQKIPDITFSLHYNELGQIDGSKIPKDLQDYMEIVIEEPHTETGKVAIIMKAKPAFTIGVDAIHINQTTNEITQLAGGNYRIDVYRGNSNGRDEIVSQADRTVHAGLSATVPGETVIYEITERQAPLGYKYKVGRNEVIGRIQVSFNTNGEINDVQLLSGHEYITIKDRDSVDKIANYDVDIQIEYEELENFTILINNEVKDNDSIKIQSTFRALLSNGMTAETTTDKDGLGMLLFEEKILERSQVVTITQYNAPDEYALVAPIQFTVRFDESGKIDSITTRGGSYAIEGEAYVITANGVGGYVMQITVKNNPQSGIKLVNYADGSEATRITSTHTLKYETKEITKETGEDGSALFALDSVPKKETVTYTIHQDKVATGYKLNKDIVIRVRYDADGIITDATLVGGKNNADETVVKVSHTPYIVNLEINNKPTFEISLTAEDEADSDIKLEGVLVSIKEETYSNIQKTFTTDEFGRASTGEDGLGTGYANKTLDYVIKVQNNKPGYQRNDQLIEGETIRVVFGSTGNIDRIITREGAHLKVEQSGPLGINLTVQYTPILEMEIQRNNIVTGQNVSGARMTISSAKLEDTIERSTNTQGIISIPNAGTIFKNEEVIYTITEEKVEGDVISENLPATRIKVVYNDKGYITGYSANPSDNITLEGQDTRKLKVIMGTGMKTRVGLINTDYYLKTTRIAGEYNITSSKGENVNISPKAGKELVMESMGRMYPGETVTYTIHTVTAPTGYIAIPETNFTVTYDMDGTITEVNSEDEDVLTVVNINQKANATTPHINLEIHSKPGLFVKINALDKQYNCGVNNIKFRVTNEDSGHYFDGTTDENGQLMLTMDRVYEDKDVTYKVEVLEYYGGYKPANNIKEFKVRVHYNKGGIVGDNGETYIENANNIPAYLTLGYSKKLYETNKLRGIELNVTFETEFGIGIEKVDIDENTIPGVEFNAYCKDVTGMSEREIRDLATEDRGERIFNKATDNNGEISNYNGEMPKNRIKLYTIEEVIAPLGYRRTEPIRLLVNFDASGKVIACTQLNETENVTVDVAYTQTCKMVESKQAVHLKVKVVDDDRVTFKIINKQNVIDTPIEGAEFSFRVQDSKGNVTDKTITTDKKGMAILENVKVDGIFDFDFSQLSVPDGILQNLNNAGRATIEKGTNVYGEYQLTLKSNTDNLIADNNLIVDSKTGIVTVYLYNDNNLTFNILDVDSESDDLTPVIDATHTIKAQIGELDDELNDIISKTDNIKIYNDGIEYISENGKTLVNLGNTYDFINKKVVFTIETPKNANREVRVEVPTEQGKPPIVYTEKQDLGQISPVRVVITFDSKGEIKSVENGKSSRLLVAEKDENIALRTNLVIGYGAIDRYRIVIAKEDSNTGKRVNGATFNIKRVENGIHNVGDITEETKDTIINNVLVNSGTITIKQLKCDVIKTLDGDIPITADNPLPVEITLTEKSVPEGYDDNLVDQEFKIRFNAYLDKTNVEEDPDAVTLKVSNLDNGGLDVEVDEYSKEVKITVKNDPVIEINLDKIDEDGNSLGGMEFDVGVQAKDTILVENIGRYTTDEFGHLKLNIKNKYAGRSVLIRLKEVKQTDYKQIPEIIIDANIKEDGNINTETLRITSGENVATIKEFTNKTISVEVRNELEEFARPYSIHVTKVDRISHDILLPNVEFQAIITPEVGPKVYRVVKTDQNGEFTIKKLTGSGNITIDLVEIKAPTGYKMLNEGTENEGRLRYEINKADGVISKIHMDTDDEKIWNIDNENYIVNITIENELDSIGLLFEKVDEADTSIKLAGAEYKLTATVNQRVPDEDEEIEEDIVIAVDSEGNPYDKEYTVVSNENGIVVFGAEKPLTKVIKATVEKDEDDEGESEEIKVGRFYTGNIHLTLREIKAPEGYDLDPKGYSIVARINDKGQLVEMNTDLEVVEKYDNDYTKYRIKDKQSYIGVPPYAIELKNVDKDDTTLPIEGAEFSFKITNSVGIGSVSVNDKVTDDKGYIQTINSINGAGDIYISVTNTKAGEGYRIDSVPTYIRVNRDLKTGFIRITEAKNVGVKVNPDTNTIEVTYESPKEKNKYAIKLNVKDYKTGLPITDTTAKYRISVADQVFEENLSNDGIIYLKRLTIPNEDEFFIDFEELKTPENQTSIGMKQSLKVNSVLIYDTRNITETKITQGYNLEKQTTSTSYIEMNLLYGAPGPGEELYLRSDKYRVDLDKNIISRVKPTIDPTMAEDDTFSIKGTKVSEFINNLDTNAETIKVYSVGKEEKASNDYVGTEMYVVATKGEKSITCKISVIGDLNGDGVMNLIDYSNFTDIMIENKEISDLANSSVIELYELAMDIDDNKSINLMDYSIMTSHMSEEKNMFL